MDTRLIFHKTPKGTEEIGARKYKLPARARTALILIDGKSTVQEISDKWGTPPDMFDLLGFLAREGFIHPDLQHNNQTPDLQMFDAPATNASDLHRIKAELIAVVKLVLGDDAIKVIKKLHAADENPGALRAAVDDCKRIVKLVIDQKKSLILEKMCQKILAKLDA